METVKQVTQTIEEVNRILIARSRELDRIAKFDEEISNEIHKLLNKLHGGDRRNDNQKQNNL